MGLVFRRRIPVSRNTWLNVSKSGVSGAARVGRVTVSTGGRITVRIAKGFSWRFGR